MKVYYIMITDQVVFENINMDSSKDIGLSQLDTHCEYEWHLPQDLGRT